MKTNNVLIRFLIVTAGAIVIDFSVYVLCCNVLPVTVSKFISEITACTYQYFLNKLYTFSYGKRNSDIKLVTKYICSQIANITTNILSNYIAYSLTGDKFFAFAAATAAATAVNYILQKHMVFKK